MYERSINCKICGGVLTALIVAVAPLHGLAQTSESTKEVSEEQTELSKVDKTEKKRKQMEQQINELQKKIGDLQEKRNEAAAQEDVIESKVAQLNAELKKAQLELQKTQASIEEVESKQESTQKTIEQLTEQVESSRKQLRGLLRLLYESEQESFIKIFFNNLSLSEVLAQRAAYEELQDKTIELIHEMKQKQQDLKAKKEKLEDQEQDLGQLAQLLANQQGEVEDKKEEQAQFLQAKRQEKLAYENKIQEAKEARKEIEQKIFTLKDAGVEVSLNNAFDMARHAGKLTGVRPALLLAVLKIESNVGNNIGNGVFPEDMHPGSREAFLRITKKLGLDPNEAQISRRPASGRGWGGAMGPAQIMPATWEGIEPRLEQLMDKSPVSPYELTDAFVATAIFLADRGATRPGGEYEAVNRYIAGPNWQYYTWYGDKVLAVAKEYEQEL